MFQIRIHGRGGQGVVTAAELLSIAAFREGRHAQAFPSFGSERTGAPDPRLAQPSQAPRPQRAAISNAQRLRSNASIRAGTSSTGTRKCCASAPRSSSRSSM